MIRLERRHEVDDIAEDSAVHVKRPSVLSSDALAQGLSEADGGVARVSRARGIVQVHSQHAAQRPSTGNALRVAGKPVDQIQGPAGPDVALAVASRGSSFRAPALLLGPVPFALLLHLLHLGDGLNGDLAADGIRRVAVAVEKGISLGVAGEGLKEVLRRDGRAERHETAGKQLGVN